MPQLSSRACKLCFLFCLKCYAPILTFWPIIPQCFAHYAWKIFHIILTKLVDNTKYETKKNKIHNWRFDLVLHTAGLLPKLFEKSKSENGHSAAMAEWAKQPYTLSNNVVGQPRVNNAGIIYLLCQHNSQMLMLSYYTQNYDSIICKGLLSSYRMTAMPEPNTLFMLPIILFCNSWELLGSPTCQVFSYYSH